MKRRGRGIACMWYPIGFTVAANPSAATVKVNEDGTATVLTGTVETGQGALTVLSQIAAEELGIAMDDIHIVSGDTDVAPMDTGAIASRTTYVTGNAIRLAAEKAKLILFDVAAPVLGVKSSQLEARDRKIQVKNFPQRCLNIGEVAHRAQVVMGEPAIGSASWNPPTVAMDPETGRELWKTGSLKSYTGASFCVKGDHAVYQTSEGMFCIHPKTGASYWIDPAFGNG